MQVQRAPLARALRLQILRGPDAGVVVTCDQPPVRIGRGPGCHVRLSDSAVSTAHVEIVEVDGRLRLRDSYARPTARSSTGCALVRPILEGTTTVRLGHNRSSSWSWRRRPTRRRPVRRWSAPRRACARSAVLARVAASDATVLIKGETGTGKEVWRAGASTTQRRAPSGPFVVVDCGAVPPSLIESELFGHEKRRLHRRDAARARRLRARPHGGTLFLDEIGELPLELQPKLLRALERARSSRVGGDRASAGRRARRRRDPPRPRRARSQPGASATTSIYRLAVVRVALPPLRERARGPAAAGRAASRADAGRRRSRCARPSARGAARARLAGQRARAAQRRRARRGARGLADATPRSAPAA